MPASRRSVEHLLAEVAALRSEAATLREELANAERSILTQRLFLPNGEGRRESSPVESLAPTREPRELSDCLEKLDELAPHAFPIWRELLDVNADTYLDFPIHSCSVEGHPMAEMFRCFLKPYLGGAVLDVGCGPQPVPYYLLDYPVERMAGVDPLPPAAPHPFVFVHGVAEFLPWEDQTFSVVVVGTSLDHVLLLDRALGEIRRVLKPDGHLVTWVSFIPGAARYDPYSPDVQKVDDYHLFHFDRPWFEDLLGVHFIAEEHFSFPHPEFSRFYSFLRR
ncbi:MAG: hypothetical protein A2V70_02130 [Planctomycetes bacterium RBG_13_63_9]|nr:MAG: hypothetical protein A2V70_02130 [Planctomycetes bacterium RBG_13_63_9]